MLESSLIHSSCFNRVFITSDILNILKFIVFFKKSLDSHLFFKIEAGVWFSTPGLVKLLLVRNPSERCTTEQAAQHPFVARQTARARPPSGAEMEISVSQAKDRKSRVKKGNFKVLLKITRNAKNGHMNDIWMTYAFHMLFRWFYWSSTIQNSW